MMRKLISKSDLRELLERRRPRVLSNIAIKNLALDGMDLTDVVFRNVDFDRCSMRSTEFSHSIFTSCSWYQCDAGESSFHSTMMNQCSFDGGSLAMSTFTDASIAATTFSGVNAIALIAPRLRANEVKISSSPLHNANFENARMHHITVSQSSLRGAKLNRCILKGGRLRTVDLAYAQMINAQLRHISLGTVHAPYAISSDPGQWVDQYQSTVEGRHRRMAELTNRSFKDIQGLSEKQREMIRSDLTKVLLQATYRSFDAELTDTVESDMDRLRSQPRDGREVASRSVLNYIGDQIIMLEAFSRGNTEEILSLMAQPQHTRRRALVVQSLLSEYGETFHSALRNILTNAASIVLKTKEKTAEFSMNI
jgi:uncharacterized protein YjbI with pentapeptide repeats